MDLQLLWDAMYESGIDRIVLGSADRFVPGSVVKLSCQASKRSASVIPAKAGIQNHSLLQNDLGMETPGFRPRIKYGVTPHRSAGQAVLSPE